MHVNIFGGKGGVGKTTASVSLALHLSEHKGRTAIIDYDGGHSVKNTLGILDELSPNQIHDVSSNLSVAIVENTEFIGIAESKKRGMPLKEYLSQFPDDLGLIPLADMVNAFFGVPTDVATLQKFTILVGLLRQFESQGFENVIIDVEPTAGLERLLSNTESTARSLLNLKNQGIISLTMLGAKWPDIAGYLKAGYIKQADEHSLNIQQTANFIKGAKYVIVSTAEIGPIKQTFEVRRIIEKFGGKVHAYVVNNLREESYEAGNIELLSSDLPIIKIKREAKFHMDTHDRVPLLKAMGKRIAEKL